MLPEPVAIVEIEGVWYKNGKRICGALTSNNAPCTRPPLANGRCRVHGGTKSIAVNGNFSLGRYAEFVPKELLEKAERLGREDPLSLYDELGLLRAILAQALEQRDSSIRGLIDDISVLVTRISQIQNSTALTMADVTFIATRIADVIGEYVPDPTKQKAFLKEIFSFAVRGDRETNGEGELDESSPVPR